LGVDVFLKRILVHVPQLHPLILALSVPKELQHQFVDNIGQIKVVM